MPQSIGILKGFHKGYYVPALWYPVSTMFPSTGPSHTTPGGVPSDLWRPLKASANRRLGGGIEVREGVIVATRRHVVPNPEGGWDVRKPSAQRVSSHHNTQAEAEARAKEILTNLGGGEAVIHGRDGRIRDSDTVAPAPDPNPPKDQRH